ncbi:MAG: hypothetical protein UHM85_06050 [Acutalibacteraceae bacterium]|nr:hypothetical protein [Acutalibacteraceae bacterium]
MHSKAFVAGTRVEHYKYLSPIRCGYSRGYRIERRQVLQDKRSANLLRAQRTVRQIIWANIGNYTKFLTLTYRDTVLDFETFKYNFAAFKKSMSRKGYKLQYLYVLERQKERGEKEGNEGCLHCHLVVFNDEYIPYQTIREAWHYGNIDIHVLKGVRYQDNHKSHEKINDLAAYVSKYITKDTVALPGNRCFSCSVGLNRPDTYRDECYMWNVPYGREGIDNPDTASLFERLEYSTKFKFTVSSTWSYVSNGEEKHNTLIYRQGVLENARFI